MQKFEDSFEGAYQSSGKKYSQGNGKKTKIIINVSETQYAVVKHTAKKLKWNLIVDPIRNLNFDVCWVDGHVRQEFFARMQPHQKINHFPGSSLFYAGMGILSRKNNLGKGLMAFRRKFPTDYEFFPITWNLPYEYPELQAYHECRQQGKAQTFIVKPEASCQGRGIFLTRNIEKLKSEKCVVQRYMHKPYLIDGLKFDLRIYVLMTGIDPLRIFVYQEGLARFATQPYKPPRSQNLQNRFMHLTNYAVNKEHPNFIFNQSTTEMNVGHKRSLTSIYEHIASEGHDVEELKRKINEIFIKTIITGYPNLSATYMSCHADNFSNDMCFEILGFDIMLDHKLTPYLIEINYTPSFTTDTPLDKHIKKNLIYDTLTLVNVNDKWKKDMKNRRDIQIQERMVSGKRKKYTNDERKTLMNQEAKKRNSYENDHLGGFTKIFLLSQQQMGENKKFYDFSFEIYNTISPTTVNNFTPINNQYLYYKHYFDDVSGPTKTQGSSSSFSKTKKYPLKQKNVQKSIFSKAESSYTQKQKQKDKRTREEITGSSQSRRVSSAKPKKDFKKQKKNHDFEKGSVKGSSKNGDQMIVKENQIQTLMDNESIFQNKILQSMVGRRKKSDVMQDDETQTNFNM